MKSERKRLQWSLRLSGKQLKIFGCAAMLCFTAAVALLQNGVLGANQRTAEALSAAIDADPNLAIWAGWSSVLQLIGSLAIPVFPFLLVEGFAHTSSFRRYLLAILACAVVSEVPYDLAMYGRVWSLEGQNAMFTCAVCLLTLYGLREFAGRRGALAWLMRLVVVLAALLWVGLLRCAFGLVSVLLAAAFYLLRERKGAAVLVGCALSAVYIVAPLSGIALWSYSGERGSIRRKYLFYALYPVHLLVLGIIGCALAA